jgi:predicted N-acetyltransferase YhbS
MTQRLSPHEIETAAREFLAAVGRPEAYEDYNYAVDVVREDGDAGWNLIVTAVAQAKSRRELEAIGAALIEELLQSFSAAYVDRIIERIAFDGAFAAAAATARLSSLPSHRWKRINQALLAAGIDEGSIVDWSTIKPLRSAPQK